MLLNPRQVGPMAGVARIATVDQRAGDVAVEIRPERRRREPIREEMNRAERRNGADGTYTYTARVAAARPAGDYMPRVSPKVDAAVPLEGGRILWQR